MIIRMLRCYGISFAYSMTIFTASAIAFVLRCRACY